MSCMCVYVGKICMICRNDSLFHERISRLEAQLRVRDEMLRCAKEALQDAVGMISSEYCSHVFPCSSEGETCYAKVQLKALAALEHVKD